MIAGCRHPESAHRFIDFVLSEDTELLLAAGAGRQIPLGPVDETQLPEELRALGERCRATAGCRLAALRRPGIAHCGVDRSMTL